MQDADEEEEADEVVAQVLDEIGVDISSAAPAAPARQKAKVAQSRAAEEEAAEDKEADELLARLGALQK